MLHHYLQSSVDDLRSLIRITQSDIEDIKEAHHEGLFSRTQAKDDLIGSFESKKALIDHEIAKLAQTDPKKELSLLLDSTSIELLDTMKEALRELKSLNHRLARMVLAVSEFYNSLLDRILPSEQNGYEGRKRAASFLQLKA